MNKLLAITTLALFAQYAHATNWVLVAENNTTKIQVDKDSIQQHSFVISGNYTTAWGRTEHRQPQNNGSYNHWQAEALYHFDCTQRKFDYAHMSIYDKQKNTIWHDNFTSSDKPLSSTNWQKIEPNTISEVHFNYACANSPK